MSFDVRGIFDTVLGKLHSLHDYFLESMQRLVNCPFDDFKFVLPSVGDPRWEKRSGENIDAYIVLNNGRSYNMCRCFNVEAEKDQGGI